MYIEELPRTLVNTTHRGSSHKGRRKRRDFEDPVTNVETLPQCLLTLLNGLQSIQVFRHANI